MSVKLQDLLNAVIGDGLKVYLSPGPDAQLSNVRQKKCMW